MTGKLGIPPESLAQALASLRREAGLDQDDFATISRVSRNTISAIERGASTPKSSTLSKIAAGAAEAILHDVGTDGWAELATEIYERLMVAAKYSPPHPASEQAALEKRTADNDPTAAAVAIEMAHSMMTLGSAIITGELRQLAELQERLGKAGAFVQFPDVPTVLSGSIVNLSNVRTGLESVLTEIERHSEEISRVTGRNREPSASRVNEWLTFLQGELQRRTDMIAATSSDSPEAAADNRD